MIAPKRNGASLTLVALLVLGIAGTVCAQEPALRTAPASRPEESGKNAVAKFLAGAAVGLGIHEAGHLAAGWRYGDSQQRAIVVTSAGFWADYLTSEIILTRQRRLRYERAPFRKGLLAFEIGTSAGYTILAFTQTGPAGRDTLELSEAAGVSERWIGALVLMPAVLDSIRYLHPETRWLEWLSRGVKVGSLAFVLR